VNDFYRSFTENAKTQKSKPIWSPSSDSDIATLKMSMDSKLLMTREEANHFVKTYFDITKITSESTQSRKNID
jgi:hypothetical protein